MPPDTRLSGVRNRSKENQDLAPNKDIENLQENPELQAIQSNRAIDEKQPEELHLVFEKKTTFDQSDHIWFMQTSEDIDECTIPVL